MKRLVRSVVSGQYLHEGRWTPDPEVADHFADSGDAINTCISQHLRDVELVLQLKDQPDDHYDLHLRLFDYRLKDDAAQKGQVSP